MPVPVSIESKASSNKERTTGFKGHNPQTRMAPTEGSKTQKRKANRGNHK